METTKKIIFRMDKNGRIRPIIRGGRPTRVMKTIKDYNRKKVKQIHEYEYE